jgi:hypothetical protein
MFDENEALRAALRAFVDEVAIYCPICESAPIHLNECPASDALKTLGDAS